MWERYINIGPLLALPLQVVQYLLRHTRIDVNAANKQTGTYLDYY